MLQSSSQNYLGELRQFIRWPALCGILLQCLLLCVPQKVRLWPTSCQPKGRQSFLLSLLHVHGQLHMHHQKLAVEAIDIQSQSWQAAAQVACCAPAAVISSRSFRRR